MAMMLLHLYVGAEHTRLNKVELHCAVHDIDVLDKATGKHLSI